MVQENILIKYFNEVEEDVDELSNELIIKWDINDKGNKRIQEFVEQLEEYAKNHEYAKFKNEFTWIENFKSNIESISNKDELWITKQDEIDYDILEEECIENDIRYDIDASWTAFRGEHFDGGAFWKINISIPIIHILYRPYGWKKIFTDIEMGEYDN
tara:strand:- start:258 stop:731 length:474 start_codon:yes stop_codon:yes gene_type:complete